MKTARTHRKERPLPGFVLRTLVVCLFLLFVAAMPMGAAATEAEEQGTIAGEISAPEMSVTEGVPTEAPQEQPEAEQEETTPAQPEAEQEETTPAQPEEEQEAEATPTQPEEEQEAEATPVQPEEEQETATPPAQTGDGTTESGDVGGAPDLTTLASGSEAGAVVGAGDTQEETYSVPVGSAYIYEDMGKNLIFKNSADDGSAIQQGLEAALTYIQGLYESGSDTANRTATVVVSKGTYENGITLDCTTPGNTMWELVKSILDLRGENSTDQLTLRIVAEDALEFDDKGNITGFNANSSGQVQLEGDINILAGKLNLDLVLAGLYLSTRGLVHTDNVGDLSIYGTSQDDYINLNATDVTGSVTIDTGAGNDVVKASVSGMAEAQAELITYIQLDLLLRAVNDLNEGTTADTISGTIFPEGIFGDDFQAGDLILKNLSKLQELRDELAASAATASTNPLKVNILAGDGNDKVELNLLDSTRLESLEIEASDVTVDLSAISKDMSAFPVSWLTKLSVFVNTGAFDVTVDGGNGADELTVTGERDSSAAFPLVKAASDYVLSQMGTVPQASVTLLGGEGDDVLTTNNSVFLATRGTTKITTQGGNGFDRLHITGFLNDDVEADKRITASVSTKGIDFSIQALASLVVNDGYTTIRYKLTYPGAYSLITRSMDAYTDELKNKNTVSLTGLTEKVTVTPFTNYLVQVGDEDGSVDFDASEYLIIPENANLLLANVLVTAADYRTITISRILAPQLNVTVSADKIDVTGTITGRNILLLSYSEDKALVEINGSGSVDTGATDGVLPSKVEIEGAKLGIYETTTGIYITIGSGAKLIAGEAVELSARLKLFHDYIPGLELLDESGADIQFNPVTVKIGNAGVTVTGTIHAGGSIRITADVDVDVDVTNGDLKAVIPVAIGVIGGKAYVTVKDSADIRSGLSAAELSGKAIPTREGGMMLRADSALRISAHAGSGLIPFSVALGVVDFETSVSVEGKAQLLAGGDIHLVARNHTVTGVSVCGYDNNKYNVKVKSGVFIAGCYGSLNTSARISGSASVRSVFGDVNVSSVSRLTNTTVAVAIPTADKDPELTMFGAIGILNNLLDLSGAGKRAAPGLLNKAGLTKLSDMFTSATDSAKGEDSLTQFLGAFAWAYLENRATATIDTLGTVQAAGTLGLYALGQTRSEVRGDGSLYKTSTLAKTPDKALGAGLALAILDNRAQAKILKGTIRCGDLDIRALLGECVSSVVAKSGHIPDTAKLGLAGAVGVQTSTYENTAAVASGVSLRLNPGASITIIADGRGWFTTVGDASGKRQRLGLDLGPVSMPARPAYGGTASSTAIGAGIAVDVIGVDTFAGIENGVIVFDIGSSLNKLTVTADFSATHYVEAAAGAQGGTSLVPVVALSLNGMNVRASVGTGSGLTLTGDVTIEANGSWIRTLISDAETAGAKAGMGAAVGVMIASDEVVAELNRSVSADNVLVNASAISRVTETVKASAKGVTPVPGTGSYGQGVTSQGSDAQQKAEDLVSGSKQDTPEKTAVGGTDSLINKMTATLSGLVARLPTGSSGNLSAGNVNQLSGARPAAGTSEGNIEVAAAVAVNIQSNTVAARIGDGLSVTAKGDISVEARQDTDATLTANGSAVKSTVGVGVAVAVNYVRYDNRATVGTGKLNAGGDIRVLATIVEDPEKRAVEEILSNLVRYFASQNGMETLLGAVAKQQGLTVEDLMDKLLREYHADYNSLSQSDKKAIADEITAMLMASLSDEPVKTSVTLAADVLESILGEFRDMLSDPQFFLGLFTGESDKIIDQAFNELKLDGRMTIDSLRALLATALTEKFGNPSELDGIGCRITTVSISGEGAANVGVAGSAAVTCVDGITLAQIASRTASQEEDIVAGGVVTIESNAAQKIYTTATASPVANGAPNKNVGKGGAKGSVGVGASFAMTQASASSKAILGENRTLTALSLGVMATAQNDVDTIAVAGQDPIGVQQNTAVTTPAPGEAVVKANNSTSDMIAADAAVALTLIDNTAYALVSTGCKLNLTGGGVLNDQLERGDYQTQKLYDLVVLAKQRGQTYTSSSGFASGGKLAVGASVAVNVVGSDVLASVSGSGTIRGGLLVNALTSNEDEVYGFAVVTGLNLDRYLSKLRSIVDLANTTDKPSTGSINAKLAGAVNGKGGSAFASTANKNLPMSGMLLQKLNIALPDAKTSQTASDAMSGSQGTGQTMHASASGQSVNIAAALGVNITNHESVASLVGSFTAGSVKVNAENRGNYRTMGTGATVTVLSVGSNNISAGVAVSVNNNKAESILGGTICTENGDVSVTARSTTNMDGKYPGLLAAQALAGAVGGTGGKVGMAGAVAVLVDQSQTKAYTQLGTHITGGDITISATEKSKLAVRAGALQAGGQTLGMGASFAIVHARNTILAEVGEYNVVSGKSLTVEAIREKITAGDYVFPFNWDTLFTVNVPDDDSANKGLININISQSSTDKVGANSLELNLSADDLLKIMDLLNYGSMTNLYVEAIAGGIAAGAASRLGLAGAVSFIYATTDTTARIGEGSRVTLTGTLTVKSENQARVRQIAGALGASKQAGVGVNMVGYVNQASHTTWDVTGKESIKTMTDQTLAVVDKNVHLSSVGGMTISATANLDVMAAAIAAGVAAGSNGAAIGGTLSTIAAGNVVKALVGSDSVLDDDDGDIQVTADNTTFVLSIAASVGAGATKVAAGGTVSAIVVENATEAALGSGVEATAKGGIQVKATSKESLIHWLCGTSVSTGNNVAAVVSALLSDSETFAKVGSKAKLTAENGSVEILANGDVYQVVVLTSAAVGMGSGNANVGAVISTDIFRQEVAALVGNSAILIAQNVTAGSNVLIIAQGRNRAYLISVAGSVSDSTVSVAGVISTVVSESTVRAELGQSAGIKAGDTIVVAAELDTDMIVIVPSVAVSAGGNVAVGATVPTLTAANTVSAIVGEKSRLIACAAGDMGYTFHPGTNRESRRRGIILKANAVTRLVQAAVSGGVTSNVGVGGVVSTMVVRNKTIAQTGKTVVLVSGYSCELGDDLTQVKTVSGTDAEVALEADDASDIYIVAGAIGGGSNVGVGASVTTVTVKKTVTAETGTGSVIRATGNATASADSSDFTVLVSMSFAGAPNAAVSAGVSTLVYDSKVTASLRGDVMAKDSNFKDEAGAVNVLAKSDVQLILAAGQVSGSATVGVAGGSNALVLSNEVLAELSGTVVATGDVIVKSDSDVLMVNVLGAVSGAGTAAVTPVAVVTSFEGSNQAIIRTGSDIDATGSFTLAAYSKETITSNAMGVSGSGTVGVSGTVVVTVSEQTTRALAEADACIEGTKILVDALDEMQFISAVGVVSGSGTSANSVIASVTVLHNTVEAKLTGGKDLEKNTIKSTVESISVTARVQRDVRAYGLAVAGAGVSAVAPSVMVLVVGGKLDKDSQELVNASFKTEKFRNNHFDSDSEYMDDLSDKLGSDDVRYSDIQVGDSTGKADFTTGYVSDDFDSGSYDDGGNTGRGENAVIKPENNATITAADGILSDSASYAPKNMVSAIVGSADVHSAKNIAVLADDLTRAEMFNVAISGSGVAAVGTGLSVAVLYSNVTAGVESGATLYAVGTITVEAVSHSTPYKTSTADDTKRNTFLSGKLKNNVKITERTIRVVSGAAAGAVAGVSVVGSAVSLSNQTSAYLNGKVTGATSLSVLATASYPHTVAATGAAGVGVAGITASFAVAVTQGKVSAGIGGNADISGVGSIQVTTDSGFNATAASAALAGGAVSVNGGVAVAVNRAKVYTFVGKDVTIDIAGSLTVTATHTSDATVYLANVAAGAVASGISVVVSIVSPTIYTYIGVEPKKTEKGSGTITVGDITVQSTVTSSAVPTLKLASGGAETMTGVVIVVINDTDAVTGIRRKAVSARDVTITATMTATATSDFSNLSIGGAVLGATVAYVRLGADNEAVLDVSGVTFTARNVTITATGTTKALAKAVIVNAGGTTVNMNVAIADNLSANKARILGSAIGSLTCTGDLTVKAEGTATAVTEVSGLNISGSEINGVVAVTVLRSIQLASIEGGTVRAKKVSVTSELNSTTTDTATAKIHVGGGALISVKAFIAVAYGRSESRALIQAKSLTATGDLTVTSNGNAGTLAKIDQTSVSGITGTVLAAFAYAQAKFYALIQGGTISGANVTVTARDIPITAVAEVTPCGLDAELTLGQIKVNIAVASAKAILEARIFDGAKVTATGNVKLEAVNTAKATAKILPVDFSASVISVAAGVASSTVGGTQTVSIEGGTVSGTAVTLLSRLNYSTSYTNKAYDSHATTGFSTGTELSYINTQVNVAKARITATVKALISGAVVTSTGNLEVKAQGSARAKADVSVGSEISAYDATVLNTTAEAAGSFTAQVTGATVDIDGETLVEAVVVADAQAITANVGGVKISAVSGKYNSADAETTTGATAAFGGCGTIDGMLSVQATGTGTANAKTQHPKITVSGVDLAANKTSAKLSGTQSAYLSVTSGKTLKVGGDITIDSDFTGNATADVGGGYGSISINVLSAEVNKTEASSVSTNKAYITGSGILTGKAVEVTATSTTTASTTTKQGLEGNLASFGGLQSDASSQDTVESYVEKVNLTAYSLKVNARGVTIVRAESNAMGSLSGVSSKKSRATAKIGTSSKKQVVHAGIGLNTTITLTDGLSVKAMNEGEATAVLVKGDSLAIADKTSSELPTVSYYDTKAYVNNGSDIHAGGSVSIVAEDSTEATSKASSKDISFAVSALEVYGKNAITTDVLTSIGSAKIFAGKDLTIKSVSNATMYASTSADGGSGFKDKSELKAENTLTRTSQVTIARGAYLESDFGDVEILAQAGAKDSIETHASLSGSGFVAYEKISTVSKVTTTSSVTVNKATITDTFGTVLIWADASLRRFYTYDYINATGVGTEPSSTANDTITLNSKVTINGSSTDGAKITARNVEIHTKFNTLGIESVAEVKTKSLASNADAKVVQSVTMTGTMTVSNAAIRGYDILRITASTAPSYKSNNVYARAKVYLGAVGHGKADVQQTATSTNTVTVNGGVAVYSANAVIRADKISGNVGYAVQTSGFIVQDKEKTIKHTFSATTTVNNGTRFYIGDAVAGIVIDVYEKNGVVQIRQVGLKNEKSIWVIDTSRQEVAFQAIANNLAGYLTMTVTSGSYKVYDQLYIPYVRISNRTDYALALSGLTVENNNYINPRVTLSGGKYTLVKNNITQPEFTVTSYGTGDVSVNGFIANPRGSVSFLWKGTVGGNLTGASEVVNVSSGTKTAPVWTRKLTIQGAANVGEDADNRFGVWLITHRGESVTALNQAADIQVEASGSVYLSLTPALMKTVAASDWGSLQLDKSAFDPNMDIRQITGGTDVDIYLWEGVRIYRKEGTSTITMPVPGTLEYVTGGMIGLTANATISERDKLEYYLESYDMATGVSVYYLPNGTRIYTDSIGQIIRITEGGVDFGLGDYSYDSTTQTITLAPGVSFSLSDGCLSVQNSYSFDALLAAISGKWLIDNWKNGTFRFLYSEEDDTGSSSGTGEDDQSVQEKPAIVTTIKTWITSGTVTYYYLEKGSTAEGKPLTDSSSLVTGSSGTENFILAYDTSDDSVRVYLLTARGSGDTSESTQEQVTFFTNNSETGYHDTYYDKKKDAYTTFKYWNDEEITVVYRSWYKGTDGEYSDKYSEGATLQSFYLVVKKSDSSAPATTLSSEYNFTSFLDVTSKSVTGFTGIQYNESDNSWKLQYTANDSTVTVNLTGVVNLGNGYFYIPAGCTSSDATANTVYSKLAGTIWKMEKTEGDSFEFDGITWTGMMDGDARVYTLKPGTKLRSYTYSITYATMAEIGLNLTPSDTEGKWDLIFTPGNAGTITIDGKTENIKMKESDIPATSLTDKTKAYRITDSLFIQSVGTDKGRAILLKDSYIATYNSITGVFESGKVKLTKLTRNTSDPIYTPTITLKAFQNVMLEAVTNNIARDILGYNYMKNASGNWVRLSSSKTIQYNQNGVTVDKNQKTTLDDVILITTTVKNGTEEVLKVEEVRRTLYVIGESEGGILAKRIVNGKAEYYLLRNGIWSSLEEYAAEALGIGLNSTDKIIFMTAATYVTTGDKIVVGSDGSVTFPQTATTTQTTQTVSGMSYYLGSITGKTVTITMADGDGSLLDGNDTASNKNMNITATDGDVTFVTSSTGSIGTRENPLEINATGEVKFRTPTGGNTLETDTFLEGMDDILLGDLIVDGQGEYGDTTLYANSKAGSVRFGNLTVIRGGVAELYAAVDILSQGKLTITTTESGENEVSLVTMAAGKSVSLGDITIEDDSRLNVTAGENVTTRSVTMKGNAGVANGTVTAGGSVTTADVGIFRGELTITTTGTTTTGSDITLGDVDVESGKLTILGAGGVHTGSFIVKEEATITAKGDVTTADMTVEGGKLTIDTEGGVSTDRFILNGEANITAGADVTTADMTVEGGKLTIHTEGGVSTDRFILNGEANITAGADVTTADMTVEGGKLTIDTEGGVSTDRFILNGEANITAGADVTTADMTVESGKLTIDTEGGVSTDRFILNGEANITAGADVATADMTVESGNLTIDTLGGMTVNGTLNSTDSQLRISVNGGITVADVLTARNSAVALIARSTIFLDNVDLTGGTFEAICGRNLYFGILEAVGTNVTLSADRDIRTTQEHGYIYFRSVGDERLTLSAGRDIGGREHYLILDTEDTLYITRAESYYLDAVVLTGNQKFLRTLPQPGAEGAGRDEEGNHKTGTLLTPEAAIDIVYGELGMENPQLVEMIIGRQQRKDWIDLLTVEALVNQIRSGTITDKDLLDLLIQDKKDRYKIQAEINRLLKQADDVKKGETESGYEQLAAWLLTAELEDEELTTLLIQAMDDELVDIQRIAQLLGDILTVEELEQLKENAWNNANYGAHEDTRPQEEVLRPIRIQVGEATGGAFVKNEGDIEILQLSGTLTAGAIISNRGNVTLTAGNGGIEGNGDDLTDITGETITLTAQGGVGANTPLTIEQQWNHPTLVGNMTKPGTGEDPTIRPIGGDGKPVTEAPWTDFALETEITFDWIRALYQEKAGRLNITAGGDVNVREVTGDMGIGTIAAKGNVSLSAPGSILDTRSEGQTGESIVATGDVALTAEAGTIGTPERPLTTDVDGVMHAQALGDISIRDSGTLDLVADSENGQVNARAEQDLTLSNTRGDLVLGPIVAGGTATIVAQGSLVEGDRFGAEAQVTANTIRLTAKNGDIGTAENPFDVDTDSENGGTLSAKGRNVYLHEVDGNLILSHVRAEGDAEITAPGHILDDNKNLSDEAEKAQKEAANADAEAKKAEAEAYVSSEAAQLARKELEEAQKAYDEALAKTPDAIEKELEKAREDLAKLTDKEEIKRQQKYIAELETALKIAKWDATNRSKARAKAEKKLREAEDAYAEALAQEALVNAQAQKKRQEADKKQALADAAADLAAAATPTVDVDGDLTLIAGGDIGEKDNSLSLRVDGKLTADGRNIYIGGLGDLHLEDVDVPGHVGISTVDGTITGDGTITADSLDISAIHGDVGEEDNYLHVSVDHLDAMGDNVYIHNDRDTQIGQIIARGDVKLDVEGNVTGDAAPAPNIIAGDTTIRAEGDIGTEEQPLDVATGGFHGTGKDIFLDNHTDHLEISDVKSDSLEVDTDGSVTGQDNWMHDIIIRADGFVGTEDDPFGFWADGYVSIRGELGTWYRNLYALRYEKTVVLRFRVTIGGQEYSLYVLVGIDSQGKLSVVGWFLCKGKATAEIWTEFLSRLMRETRVISLGTVYADDEAALESCLEEFLDTSYCELHRRVEEVGLEQALHENVGDLSRELEAFMEALNESLTAYADMDTALEALDGFMEEFTEDSDLWKVALRALAMGFPN